MKGMATPRLVRSMKLMALPMNMTARMRQRMFVIACGTVFSPVSDALFEARNHAIPAGSPRLKAIQAWAAGVGKN